MSFEELLRRLTDEGDWKLEMGTSYDEEDGDMLFVAKVTLFDSDKGYGAVARSPLAALELAVDAVLKEEDDMDDLDGAAKVLKATLDELGFDRAVSLLERLNNL